MDAMAHNLLLAAKLHSAPKFFGSQTTGMIREAYPLGEHRIILPDGHVYDRPPGFRLHGTPEAAAYSVFISALAEARSAQRDFVRKAANLAFLRSRLKAQGYEPAEDASSAHKEWLEAWGHAAFKLTATATGRITRQPREGGGR